MFIILHHFISYIYLFCFLFPFYLLLLIFSFYFTAVISSLELSANVFINKSVTGITRQSYLKAFQSWSLFLNQHYPTVSPTLIGIPVRVGVNLLIAFMSHLFQTGLRGTRLNTIMSKLKFEMLINGYSIVYFKQDRYLQALKSSRYTIDEIKINSVKKLYGGQLPVSYDMIHSIKPFYWPSNVRPNDPTVLYDYGVFLCIEVAFDTGRRICSFVHAENKQEDHCIKCNQVIFHFHQTTLYPFKPMVHAGPEFQNYVVANNIPCELVKQIQLNFHTQKSSSRYKIQSEKPIYIGTTTTMEAELMKRLFLWCCWNNNSANDGLFTRCSSSGIKKQLLRKDVMSAIRLIATHNGIGPNRLGAHSLRRGYATLNDAYNKFCNKTNYDRAGWKSNSSIPQNIYSRAEINGAYSMDITLFNLEHVQALCLPGASVGDCSTSY